MGQSTNAVLFYGYCWAEERGAPWLGEDEYDADGEDWEERYAKARGVHPPTEDYPAAHDKSEKAEATRAAYAEFWTKKEEAAKASGCLIGSHCSSECPMPYVAMSESRTLALRGFPEQVTSLAVSPGWRERLDGFCRVMGITPPEGQEPGWWLVSDWS